MLKAMRYFWWILSGYGKAPHPIPHPLAELAPEERDRRLYVAQVIGARDCSRANPLEKLTPAQERKHLKLVKLRNEADATIKQLSNT